MMVKRWTVGELTRYVRQLIETDYRLQELEVEGEVSNLRVPGSGHAYFTLKDEQAQLKCVMWRDAVQAHRRLPRDGERVIALGSVGVYEAGGQYQLYCQTLMPVGEGDLYRQFIALKERLEAEGWFAPERKQPLPERPRTIGVVTGEGTAALQDVLNVIRRRYPLARVIVSPTPVQGEGAPPQIAAALRAINRHPDVDLILLVRGGGSIEDLWGFNDERVVQAVAQSALPVITGVGHETDFTLADFAADQRAPTPSAAAELATPVTVDDLQAYIDQRQAALSTLAMMALRERRQQVDGVADSLLAYSPLAAIGEGRGRVEGLAGRAARAVSHALALRRERLDGLAKALQAMSPGATLGRGYALVYGPGGGILRRAADAAPGDRLRIRLQDGELDATVVDRESEEDG
jgi:exodeoxyribonuclease VII large subunit